MDSILLEILTHKQSIGTVLAHWGFSFQKAVVMSRIDSFLAH